MTTPESARRHALVSALAAGAGASFSGILERLGVSAQEAARLLDGGRGEASALMQAAQADNAEAIRLLLPFCDARRENRLGQTALACALINRCADAVDALLAHPPALAANADGVTPLMWAARSGSVDFARRLLPLSDLLAVDNAGETASMHAISGGAESLRELLAAEKRAALAAAPSLPGIPAPGAPHFLRRNAAGETLLMLAIFRGDAECARLALRADPLAADPLACDASGRTALMVAAEFGLPDALRLLLPVSDARARDQTGATALMRAAAAQENAAECARALLPASDPDAADEEGRTALFFAANRFADPADSALDALWGACDASARMRHGRTLLMHAVLSGAPAALLRKIAARSDFNAQDHAGLSVFDHARRSCCAAGIELALAAGCGPSSAKAARKAFLSAARQAHAAQSYFSEAPGAWAATDALAPLAPLSFARRALAVAGPASLPRLSALLSAAQMREAMAERGAGSGAPASRLARLRARLLFLREPCARRWPFWRAPWAKREPTLGELAAPPQGEARVSLAAKPSARRAARL